MEVLVSNKLYENNSALNEKILAGVNTLADNVASTLGPRGRNVLLHQEGKLPTITKDGVTVAQFVELPDPFENAAAQVLKQAASMTNSSAGDGTTTATVLARGIMNAAQKHIAAGASQREPHPHSIWVSTPTMCVQSWLVFYSPTRDGRSRKSSSRAPFRNLLHARM